MDADKKTVKGYVWDLTKAITDLFSDALGARDREAAGYFAGELIRVGDIFFTRARADEHDTKPTELPRSIERSDKPPLVASETDVKTKKYKMRSHLALGELETKTLSHIFLADDDPPVDLDGLVELIYPQYTHSSQMLKMGARGRVLKALKGGAAKLSRILLSGTVSDGERDFLRCLQDRVPQGNQLADYTEQMIARYYQAKTERVGLCTKCGMHPITIKKRGLCRICANQFYRNDGVGDVVETTTESKLDWINLLYTAFFHPDGASLDHGMISKRTKISLDMVPAVLGGALDTLRDHWDKGEEEADKEAAIFIRMIREHWPDQSLDKVLENVELDGREDSEKEVAV